MNFINLYKIKYSLKTILQILLYPLVYLINFYLEKKNIFFLFSNAAALGDNVVTTGLISQVKTKTNCKIILFSKLIEVFENNPNINSIIDLNKKNYLFYVLILLQGKRVVEFNINTYPYVDIFELLKATNNKNFSKHLSEVSAPENLSKYIDFNKFKNEIFFSNLEIEKFNIKYKNIFIKLYKDNYKNLYKMNKKFSFIFCNSVVQYFSNKNEIIELVKAVKKTSIKGTKFLISDIMDIKEKKNLFRFIFYSFLRGYFFSLIKHYFILILNPEYRKLEIKYKLLRVDTHKIIKEIKPLCKKVKIIYTPLTINVNRKHILIEF